MRLFDRTLETLSASLDARLLRQNVLSSNIANIDTPGFQPKELDFAREMKDARAEIANDHRGALPDALRRPAIIDGEQGSPGPDGNTVDLDRTLTSLAENALQYGAATRAAGKKLAILRYVASDGNA
jgi:flagellar basal-body rod protein FlgB